MKRYRISPSLLNKMSDWLNSDEIYNKFWGEAERPAMDADGFRAKQLAELLAYINREPQPPSEAADRGTALNEIVDRLIDRGSRPDIEVQRDGGAYICNINDFMFKFDRALVESLALMFKTATPQYHLQHVYNLEVYEVELHGFADYIFPTMIWDLKTTGKYEGEKYAQNWQRWVYPLTALDSGALTACDNFTFYALEMRKDRDSGILTAKPYAETYSVNVEECRYKVIEFIGNVVVPTLNQWHKDGLIDNNNIIREV